MWDVLIQRDLDHLCAAERHYHLLSIYLPLCFPVWGIELMNAERLSTLCANGRPGIPLPGVETLLARQVCKSGPRHRKNLLGTVLSWMREVAVHFPGAVLEIFK